MKFKKQHTPSLHEKMKKRKGIRKKDTRYTVFSRQYEVKEKSKKEKKKREFQGLLCFYTYQPIKMTVQIKEKKRMLRNNHI